MDIEAIKSTVRAMLSKTAPNSGCTDAEKDEAMRQVTKWMDQYNLREEDLADADGVLESLNNAETGKTTVNVGVRTSYWMVGLCVFIQDILGTVKSYVVKSADKKSTNCVFYGVLADCEIAAEIYSETRDYIETAAATKYGGYKLGEGRSYCVGFVAGLAEQLERIKAANATTSSALTVARNAIVLKKHDIAVQWAADRGLKLKSYKPQTRIKPSAFDDGFEDGVHHSVNKDRRKKLTN